MRLSHISTGQKSASRLATARPALDHPTPARPGRTGRAPKTKGTRRFKTGAEGKGADTLPSILRI